MTTTKDRERQPTTTPIDLLDVQRPGALSFGMLVLTPKPSPPPPPLLSRLSSYYSYLDSTERQSRHAGVYDCSSDQFQHCLTSEWFWGW